MTGPWELAATGTVVRVEREDRDKTGRGQKVTYVFFIKPEVVHAGRPDAKLGEEIAFRALDTDLAKLTPDPPKIGDRVKMTGRGDGRTPDSFYLLAVHRSP